MVEAQLSAIVAQILADAYALNLTLDGSAFSPLDEARQARGQLGEAMSAVDPGRHDSTDRAELDRMVWGDRDTASGPGARADGRMNAAGQEGGASPGHVVSAGGDPAGAPPFTGLAQGKGLSNGGERL